MTEDSYEPIDDLLAQIRLRLLKVRESDPATAEELKSLFTQLEDWLESLVIDSLKLRSLESRPKKATESKKRPTKRLGRKKEPAK